MKLTYKSGPNKGQTRDSKCEFGCGYDSKGTKSPIVSIALHESKTHGKVGVQHQRKLELAESQPTARQRVGRARDVDHRIVETLHLAYPKGIRPDEYVEAVTLIGLLRGVINGT